MSRITSKDLENVVRRINEVTGNATESYTEVDGQFKGNIGNYHISGAYGGVALHQMVIELTYI